RLLSIHLDPHEQMDSKFRAAMSLIEPTAIRFVGRMAHLLFPRGLKTPQISRQRALNGRPVSPLAKASRGRHRPSALAVLRLIQNLCGRSRYSPPRSSRWHGAKAFKVPNNISALAAP